MTSGTINASGTDYAEYMRKKTTYGPDYMRHMFGVSVAPMTYGHRGAGISMAQQQRASRKARNVKRHKRQVRG